MSVNPPAKYLKKVQWKSGNRINISPRNVFLNIHSETLKIKRSEGKRIQYRNFADRKKNTLYANDPILLTMRVTVHPAVVLQSGRERQIIQR